MSADPDAPAELVPLCPLAPDCDPIDEVPLVDGEEGDWLLLPAWLPVCEASGVVWLLFDGV
jgi:hypothetical protein